MDPVRDARALVSERFPAARAAFLVFVETAELALLLAGNWLGSGKWLLRELRTADPLLADKLVAAHDQPVDLASLADQVLARSGGRLWAGYRQPGKL